MPRCLDALWFPLLGGAYSPMGRRNILLTFCHFHQKKRKNIITFALINNFWLFIIRHKKFYLFLYDKWNQDNLQVVVPACFTTTQVGSIHGGILSHKNLTCRSCPGQSWRNFSDMVCSICEIWLITIYLQCGSRDLRMYLMELYHYDGV